MDGILLFIALILAKFAGFLTRLFNMGSGQTLPGLIALKIYPKLIQKLSSQIKKQKIIITATNGKTTVAAMIGQFLTNQNIKFVNNLTGSNLARGIAASLVNKSNLFGKLNLDYGIFEVDEALLPYAIKNINPQIVVLGNLFRDQLDRYGEVDAISKKWQSALKSANKNINLICNADDPAIANSAQYFSGRKIFYGINDKVKKENQKVESARDTNLCFNCFSLLTYKNIYFAHLGDYYCPNCDFKKPKLDFFASGITAQNNRIAFKLNNSKIQYNFNIAGVYNIYNILAATLTLKTVGFDEKEVLESIKNFKPVFGRMETFKIDGKKFEMILIKNPAGANAVLNALDSNAKYFILALNDKLADGTDVSWIWDTDWEKIAQAKEIFFTGSRKYAIALRLKYAGFSNIKTFNNYWEAINEMSKKATSDEKIYILPSYTAMLEIRKILENKKIVGKV